MTDCATGNVPLHSSPASVSPTADQDALASGASGGSRRHLGRAVLVHFCAGGAEAMDQDRATGVAPHTSRRGFLLRSDRLAPRCGAIRGRAPARGWGKGRTPRPAHGSQGPQTANAARTHRAALLEQTCRGIVTDEMERPWGDHASLDRGRDQTENAARMAAHAAGTVAPAGVAGVAMKRRPLPQRETLVNGLIAGRFGRADGLTRIDVTLHNAELKQVGLNEVAFGLYLTDEELDNLAGLFQTEGSVVVDRARFERLVELAASDAAGYVAFSVDSPTNNHPVVKRYLAAVTAIQTGDLEPLREEITQ